MKTLEHQTGLHPELSLCQKWVILSWQVALQSWHFSGSAGYLLVQRRKLSTWPVLPHMAERLRELVHSQQVHKRSCWLASCHVLLARWWQVAAHWCVGTCLKAGCACVLQCALLTWLTTRKGHGRRDWAGMLHLTSSPRCLPEAEVKICCYFSAELKPQPFSYLCCKQTFSCSAEVQGFKFILIGRKHPL